MWKVTTTKLKSFLDDHPKQGKTPFLATVDTLYTMIQKCLHACPNPNPTYKFQRISTIRSRDIYIADGRRDKQTDWSQTFNFCVLFLIFILRSLFRNMKQTTSNALYKVYRKDFKI